MSGDLLSVDTLSAGYGRKQVLTDVSFDFGYGEARFVIGPNGAGKTTLLQSISGLMNTVKGEIRWEGKRVNTATTRELARQGLIYIPQENDVFPSLTVRENLLVQLAALGLSRRDKRLNEVIELFPAVQRRLSQRAGTLSGGERRQLSIARGLLGRPKLLICDEPTLGLSPIAIGEVCSHLRALCADGVAILIAEQNVPCIEAVGGNGGVLLQGRYQDIGSASDLRTSEVVQRALLGGSPLVAS